MFFLTVILVILVIPEIGRNPSAAGSRSRHIDYEWNNTSLIMYADPQCNITLLLIPI